MRTGALGAMKRERSPEPASTPSVGLRLAANEDHGAGLSPASSPELARAEFLSLVSHELRTPLNGVLGLAALLAHRLQDDPISREMLAGIASSGEILNRIVEAILRFTELEGEDVRLDEARVETQDLLTAAVALAGPQAKAAGKSMRLDEAVDRTCILADARRLEIALACLIGNSITHGGPCIKVGCHSDGSGEAAFFVRDNGAGIPAAKALHVLRPFCVGEEVSTRRAGGIGMGLSLTNRIVELHGGKLTIERNGDWTVAAIRLPAWRSQRPGGSISAARHDSVLADEGVCHRPRRVRQTRRF